MWASQTVPPKLSQLQQPFILGTKILMGCLTFGYNNQMWFIDALSATQCFVTLDVF